MQLDPRRHGPRVDVEALCWELVDHDREMISLVVDLSSEGARVERPYNGERLERKVPLAIEIPGIDETMWARGDLVFDQLVPMAGPDGGPFGMLRRTGYHLALAASRDLRLLRDYVHSLWQPEPSSLELASCYSRG